MKQSWFLVILILFCCPVLKAEENELLSYKSFIDYIESGQVKFVKIGDFDMKDLEVVVVKDGTEHIYFVDRPYRAGEDPLLIRLLTQNFIPHEILERDHSPSFAWETYSIVMFNGPMLISILILFIALLIYRKAKYIEMTLQSKDQGPGTDQDNSL
jgi:ATP-dependent Zn protease